MINNDKYILYKVYSIYDRKNKINNNIYFIKYSDNK